MLVPERKADTVNKYVASGEQGIPHCPLQHSENFLLLQHLNENVFYLGVRIHLISCLDKKKSLNAHT